MIKTIKTKQFKIIAALLAVVLTVSCITWNATSVRAEEVSIGGANVQSYNLFGSSRAIVDDKLKGLGATLGLYVNDAEEKYKADHELYVQDSVGEWSLSSGIINNDTARMIFNGWSFDYIAYSPYYIERSSGIVEDDTIKDCLYDDTTFSVPTDGNYGESTDSVSGSQYDLLWGKGTSNTENLTPTLQHVLTMLTVNITGYGTEIEGNPTITGVTIGGTVVTGDLNLTGATKASEVVTIPTDSVTDPADITAMQLTEPNIIDPADLSKGSYEASYEALILPQTAELSIIIKLSNNQVFITTVSSQAFVSGTAYNINLQVGQDTVSIGAITAESWNPSNGGVLETE